MFVEAEDNVLRGLALAPLVAMVCAVGCVSAGPSSVLREAREERTVPGDDRMQVQNVFIQRVPERVVLALVLLERRRLGRAVSQNISWKKMLMLLTPSKQSSRTIQTRILRTIEVSLESLDRMATRIT